MDTEKDYPRLLGGLVGNLHSLEFALRVYLGQRIAAARLACGTDVYDFPVGAELPLTDLTSYATLGMLLREFNDDMRRACKPEIDETIVLLRDALAHGRVLRKSPEVIYGLLSSARSARVAFVSSSTRFCRPIGFRFSPLVSKRSPWLSWGG